MKNEWHWVLHESMDQGGLLTATEVDCGLQQHTHVETSGGFGEMSIGVDVSAHTKITLSIRCDTMFYF